MNKHFDVMLDVGAVDFKEKLLDALGVTSFDQVTFSTPQFDRTDGIVVSYFPRTIEEFDALKKLPDESLRSIGCGLWDDGHWLYPASWYWNIPVGYLVTDINDNTEPFMPGKTDDDRRFGMLAYGFKKEPK